MSKLRIPKVPKTPNTSKKNRVSPPASYSPQDKMKDTLIKNHMIPRFMWKENVPQFVVDKYNELVNKSEELGISKLGIGRSENRGWFLVNTKDPVKERMLEIVWSEIEQKEVG